MFEKKQIDQWNLINSFPIANHFRSFQLDEGQTEAVPNDFTGGISSCITPGSLRSATKISTDKVSGFNSYIIGSERYFIIHAEFICDTKLDFSFQPYCSEYNCNMFINYHYNGALSPWLINDNGSIFACTLENGAYRYDCERGVIVLPPGFKGYIAIPAHRLERRYSHETLAAGDHITAWGFFVRTYDDSKDYALAHIMAVYAYDGDTFNTGWQEKLILIDDLANSSDSRNHYFNSFDSGVIVVCFGGALKITNGTDHYKLSERELLLLGSLTDLKLTSLSNACGVIIKLYGQTSKRLLGDFLRYENNLQRVNTDFIEKIALAANRTRSTIGDAAAVFDIFLNICSVYQQHELPPHISAAIKIIRQYIDKNPSVSFIAKKLHMSREYLSRSFTAAINQPIGRYIDNVKFSRCCDLLLFSSQDCYCIAEQIGFSSYSNFCRFFKKHSGKTPTEYRRLNRQ